MAALDFPANPTAGQVYEGENGVIYTYVGTAPNGHWSAFAELSSESFADIFVEVKGDNMTGSLTLGPPGDNKITLKADGTSTFKGLAKVQNTNTEVYDPNAVKHLGRNIEVQNLSDTIGSYSGIRFITTSTGENGAAGIYCVNKDDLGNADLVFTPRSNTTEESEKLRITSEGEVKIGVTGSFTPSAPAISLNANGTATFNTPTESKSGFTYGLIDGESTTIFYQNDYVGNLRLQIRPDQLNYRNVAGDTTVTINSADGNVKLGGTLPSAPAISLNAANGDISMVGNLYAGDNVNPGADTDRGFAVVNGVNRCAVRIQSKSVDSEGSVLKIFKGTSETFSVTNTGNVIAVGDIQSTSQNGGPLSGCRNAIQNGGLDVWQRGSAAFSGGAQYTADRWFVASASATTTKEYGPLTKGTAASYALKVTDPTTICEARQNIEYLLAASKNNPAPFAVGKEYTISGWALVTAGVEFQVNIIHRAGNIGAYDAVFFDKSLIGDGNWQKFSYTFTMTSQSGGDKNCLQVQLRTGSPGEMTISQIQLEPGPVATPFENRPYATELALCQRYYQTIDSVYLGVNKITSGTTGVKRLDFSRPVVMRAMPTQDAATISSTVTLGGSANTFSAYQLSDSSLSTSTAILGYTADAEL